MLEHIFGSNARVALLRIFLNNPDKFFFVRQLTRTLKMHLNSIRRELTNLEQIGIIRLHTKEDLEKEAGKKLKDNKKYYKLNNSFIFTDELRSILIKAHIILEQDLATKVEKLGGAKLFLLSGVFVGRKDAPADLLIVGKVGKIKLAKLISSFESELDCEINYTIITLDDFNYRLDVADKFIYDLLENKNFIVCDKILNKKV